MMFATAFCSAPVSADDSLSLIEVTDLSGKLIRPLAPSDAKGVVVIFILPDCPISNAYAPEMVRIAKDYKAKGMVTWLVYADREITSEAAREHAKERDFPSELLLDRDLRLAKSLSAKRAPEAVLLDENRRVRYRGRINDLYVDFGKRRAEASTHYLREAIDALLESRPSPRADVESIGCPLDFRPE